jgi:hypothetical protein
MPYVSRLFVKTGIVYLLVTFLAGGVMLCLEALGRPVPAVFGIEHAHAGFIGWLVNTVIGIGYWLLPLNRRRFPQTQGRYPQGLAVTSFYMLNVGLVVRLVTEPWFSFHPAAIGSGLLVASSVLQVLGIASIAWVAWQRVFPPPLRPSV